MFFDVSRCGEHTGEGSKLRCAQPREPINKVAVPSAGFFPSVNDTGGRSAEEPGCFTKKRTIHLPIQSAGINCQTTCSSLQEVLLSKVPIISAYIVRLAG